MIKNMNSSFEVILHHVRQCVLQQEFVWYLTIGFLKFNEILEEIPLLVALQ